MIKIENFETMGWDYAIRGMRNPMNSWNKSDSGICKGCDNGAGCENCVECEHFYDHSWQLGKADHELMIKLAKAGSVHGKFRRMIAVYADITAPLYWWKEFDTYKVGTVANSCSTMHKIHAKKFEPGDFSSDQLDDIWGYEPEVRDMAPAIEFVTGGGKNTNLILGPEDILNLTVKMLNRCRELYLETKEKAYWWQMVQLLPSSYNQKRTVMLNYEVLSNIYQYRREHKLDEWCELCQWVETLPYSEIITCNAEEENHERTI